MNIEIQAESIPAEKDVQRFVRNRARLALSPLDDRINLVSVIVDEVDEPGDNSEMHCRVLIRSGMQPDIIVEGSDPNLYSAIHRTMDDAGWTLAGNLMRHQSSLLNRQFKMIEDRSPETGPTDYLESGRAASGRAA